MTTRFSRQQQQVNNEWNAMAGEWDDLASKYRDGFMSLLLQVQETKSLFSFNNDDITIVDFGCGTGLLTEGMRQALPSTTKSKFVCIDAASSMVQSLRDKVRAGDWDNVQTYNVGLSHYDNESGDETTKAAIDDLKGTVDLIVASSVISFIPPDDLSATMKVLGAMLKPGGGVLCHSDWPQNDQQHPDGFTDEKAEAIYQMAGLTKKSSLVTTIDMGGGHRGDVFFGVAVKP
jgi:SAM-dependent methyltransferase